MSSIIIKQFVFEEHSTTLGQLSGAIENIADQVFDMFRNLPEEKQELLGERFELTVQRISQVCDCLANVAINAAYEADKWAVWARENNIDIHFRYPALQGDPPRQAA